jgi:DeoR/GlpR family transcriptional regulator of sugar metabolism
LFAAVRRNKILELLNENKSITVQEAAQYFNVVEETIRRDLNNLEEQNLLIRTHGGAVAIDDVIQEISYDSRKKINILGKDKIGQEAAKLVESGDTIILDASTSSFFLAKYIKSKKNVTVITNAENVIHELLNCEDIEVISTGGVLRRKSMSYVGRMAEFSLQQYHANKLFFSCMGFSLVGGLTDSSGQESDMKKIMISCSQTKYFLCDNTKFNKVGYASTARADEINFLITEKVPDQIEAIKNMGIEVVVSN